MGSDPVEESDSRPVRCRSFGEDFKPSWVDRYGIWLSQRQIERSAGSLTGKRLADVGCGYHATLSRGFVDRLESLNLYDVSISPDLTEHPKVVQSAGTIPESLASARDGAVDTILCMNVIEHLWEPEVALAHFYRMLSPGGRCLINVPSWLGKTFLEFSAFRLELSPREEMNDHKMYYDKRDLWPLLVQCGFKPDQIKLFYHKFRLNLFAVCSK